MSNKMGLILEGLNEAKQDIWIIEYKGIGIVRAELVCNTREYNKIKKSTPGYKEIEAYNITKDRGPNEWKVFVNSIKDSLNKMGVKKFNDFLGQETKDGHWCFVIGKDNTPFFGYKVLTVKEMDPDEPLDSEERGVTEAVTMIETDADAQYEIFKKTGKYPEEDIVKATWKLEKADDNNIFLTKDGKKRKFKVIPDNRGMRGFVGKPMKTGVKAVDGVDGFISAMEKEIKNSAGGKSTIARQIFNGIWDTCKDAK